MLGCAGDGDGDVAIARSGNDEDNLVYINRGGTKFSIASSELKGVGSRQCYTETTFAGVTPRVKCYESGLSDTTVVSMVDYNGDGLLDLYVGNEVMADQSNSNMGFGNVRDELYRNNGDGTKLDDDPSRTPCRPLSTPHCTPCRPRYPRLVHASLPASLLHHRAQARSPRSGRKPSSKRLPPRRTIPPSSELTETASNRWKRVRRTSAVRRKSTFRSSTAIQPSGGTGRLSA